MENKTDDERITICGYANKCVRNVESIISKGRLISHINKNIFFYLVLSLISFSINF